MTCALLALLTLLLAAPAALAAPAPDLSALCSLSLVMKTAEGTAIPGGRAAVYRVADWTPSGTGFVWTCTAPYAACGIPAAELEDDGSADALAAHTRTNTVAGEEAALDGEGKTRFAELAAGLYLVMQTEPAPGYRAFAPFLVALPHYSTAKDRYDGYVTASPKVTPPPGPPADPTPPDPTPPDPAPPEPPPDPTPPEPPTPDPAPPEPTLPEPPPGPKLPQTGQLWWPVPALFLSGLLLRLLARILRKRADDDG